MNTKKNAVVMVLDEMIEKSEKLGRKIEYINLNKFDYLSLFEYLKVNKSEGEIEEEEFFINDDGINFLPNPQIAIRKYKGIPVYLHEGGYYTAFVSFKPKQALEKDEIKQTNVAVKDETSFINRLLLKVREIMGL